VFHDGKVAGNTCQEVLTTSFRADFFTNRKETPPSDKVQQRTMAGAYINTNVMLTDRDVVCDCLAIPIFNNTNISGALALLVVLDLERDFHTHAVTGLSITTLSTDIAVTVIYAVFDQIIVYYCSTLLGMTCFTVGLKV